MPSADMCDPSAIVMLAGQDFVARLEEREVLPNMLRGS